MKAYACNNKTFQVLPERWEMGYLLSCIASNCIFLRTVGGLLLVSGPVYSFPPCRCNIAIDVLNSSKSHLFELWLWGVNRSSKSQRLSLPLLPYRSIPRHTLLLTHETGNSHIHVRKKQDLNLTEAKSDSATMHHVHLKVRVCLKDSPRISAVLFNKFEVLII